MLAESQEALYNDLRSTMESAGNIAALGCVEEDSLS